MKPTYVTLIHNSRLIFDITKFSIYLEWRSLSDWKSPNVTQIATDCLMPYFVYFYPKRWFDTYLRYSYTQFQINNCCWYYVLLHHTNLMSRSEWYKKSSFTTFCQFFVILLQKIIDNFFLTECKSYHATMQRGQTLKRQNWRSKYWQKVVS